MAKSKFKVIDGGLLSPISSKKKYFVNAYATDTRLMGVISVYACWKLSDTGENTFFHQFFYIDCEEAGLETYKSILGDSIEDIRLMEQALVGGLGARRIEITERQLVILLSYYADFNNANGLPLPDNQQEYSFLTENVSKPSPDELSEVFTMICSPIETDYQAVNYFLMRCFGRDYRAAAFLSNGSFPLDLYDKYVHATFCKNVIDKEKTYSDGAVSYLCESLVEMNGEYDTIVSKVVVKDLKVIGFEYCSGFPVSPVEAAMMLSKPEFVTVFEVLLSNEDMDNNIGELTVNLNTVMSIHENGRLFMAFKQNNDHVNSPVFLLSNDVRGIYFLTDYGQLIVSAHTLSDIKFLEMRLKTSPLSPFLMVTSKYEFKEPVVFEYMNSEFEDFEDFIDSIRED